MKDYLKELCSKSKIKLIYTHNKGTALSSTLYKNIPVLRVHHMFSGASEKISNAIIDYYTFKGNGEDYLKLIKEFIEEFPKFKKYKVLPPDDRLKAFYKGNIDIKPIKRITSEVEADIYKLTQKSFRRNAYFQTNDNTINVSEDDLLEIDVVISPFNT